MIGDSMLLQLGHALIVIDIEPKIKLETTKFKTLLTFYFPLIFARYMPIC